MNCWQLTFAVVIATAGVYATIPGNYEINVQLVPPLVTEPCRFGEWWRLPNMSCAICFCMTGSLSRCLPQMGCLPSAIATTAATPTTVATPTTATATNPPAMANESAATNETVVSPTPATTTTTAAADSSSPAAPTNTPSDTTEPPK